LALIFSGESRMTDLSGELKNLQKERLQLEKTLEQEQKKGFFSRLFSGKSAQVEKQLAEVVEKIGNLEKSLHEQEIKAREEKDRKQKELEQQKLKEKEEAEQREKERELQKAREIEEKEQLERDLKEAQEYFVGQELGDISVQVNILQTGLTIFRDELPDAAPESKDQLIDKAITHIIFAILGDIRDSDGNPDKPLEAQAYFTLGVAYYDQAIALNSQNLFHNAHDAYNKAKKIAEEIRKKGLIIQLEGAIQQISETYPEYDGNPRDCFITDTTNYSEKFEYFKKILSERTENEKDTIEFDVDE